MKDPGVHPDGESLFERRKKAVLLLLGGGIRLLWCCRLVVVLLEERDRGKDLVFYPNRALNAVVE
jgi:hypothetical protein